MALRPGEIPLPRALCVALAFEFTLAFVQPMPGSCERALRAAGGQPTEARWFTWPATDAFGWPATLLVSGITRKGKWSRVSVCCPALKRCYVQEVL